MQDRHECLRISMIGPLCLCFATAMLAMASMVSADEGFEGDEGGFHTSLMSLAALLGILAALTGMRNSRIKAISRFFPKAVPRILHRWISAAYYLLYFGTFIVWSIVFYQDRGSIYFTLHGQIGLLSVILAVLGIVTGIVMLKRPAKLWRFHWVFNIASLILMIVTIILGLGLED